MADLRSSSEEADRRQFVADVGVLAELGLTVDDLADPGLRTLVIEREHPELQAALGEDAEEIDLGHGPINPRM